MTGDVDRGSNFADPGADPAVDRELTEISALLDGMAPAPLRVAVTRINRGDVAELRAAEFSIVAAAIGRRQDEFASGRALLRSLLRDRVEIGRCPNGAPSMPPGWVGTISHDRSCVLGVVGPTTFARAIGVDLEHCVDLPPQEAALIVRSDDVVPDPLTAFVLKEAVYKAWSGLGGRMLEHHDVRVVVDSGRFRSVVLGNTEMTGVFGTAGGRCVALVVVPAG